MSAASPRDIYQSVTLSTSLLRSWKYDRNRGKILEFGKDEEIALHIVHIEDHRDVLERLPDVLSDVHEHHVKVFESPAQTSNSKFSALNSSSLARKHNVSILQSM
mgnify:CR=1